MGPTPTLLLHPLASSPQGQSSGDTITTNGETRWQHDNGLMVSPAQDKGGWTLSIAGAGQNTYRTKDEAVNAGASKGRQERPCPTRDQRPQRTHPVRAHLRRRSPPFKGLERSRCRVCAGGAERASSDNPAFPATTVCPYPAILRHRAAGRRVRIVKRPPSPQQEGAVATGANREGTRSDDPTSCRQAPGGGVCRFLLAGIPRTGRA